MENEKKAVETKKPAKPVPGQTPGASVKLILGAPRRIAGKAREPKYTLLEGVCGKAVTADELTKAIATGAVRVEESAF